MKKRTLKHEPLLSLFMFKKNKNIHLGTYNLKSNSGGHFKQWSAVL